MGIWGGDVEATDCRRGGCTVGSRGGWVQGCRLIAEGIEVGVVEQGAGVKGGAPHTGGSRARDSGTRNWPASAARYRRRAVTPRSSTSFQPQLRVDFRGKSARHASDEEFNAKK